MVYLYKLTYSSRGRDQDELVKTSALKTDIFKMCCWKKSKQTCWKDFGPSSQASRQILIGDSTLLTLLENKCSPTNSWFKQPIYHGKKSHQFITSFNNFKIYTPQKSNIDTKNGPYLKGITFFKPSFWVSSRSFSGGLYVWMNFHGYFHQPDIFQAWSLNVCDKTKLCRNAGFSERIPLLEV